MGRERHMARLVTISFVTHGDDVLLIRHAADGDRFRGQWNGIGGHVDPGEDVRGAARRELIEEAGIVAPLSLRGVVHESELLGHAHVLFIFVGTSASRDFHAREGHELAWHPIDRVGELPLVHDVEVLLPRALAAREPFFATETYDGGDRRTHIAFDDPGAARVG